MRKAAIVLAAMAAFGISLSSSLAQEGQKKSKEISGVLIDNMCGDKMAKKADAEPKDIQATAAGHGKACAIKCAKDGGLALMSEGKMMKLDEKSNEKALAYLGEKEHGTAVVVTASKNEDGTLALAEIKPAKKEGKEGEKSADHKH